MIKFITESTEYLQSKGFDNPEIGIILGTGLGQLIDEIEIIAEASYNHIPNFPTATVEFHKGKLVYGILAEKKVVVMQGRFHVYEGYTLQDVTFPVRIMEKLGIKTLLVSNASGAINLDYKKGELMLIDDHINLQGGSPLAFKATPVPNRSSPDSPTTAFPCLTQAVPFHLKISTCPELLPFESSKGAPTAIISPALFKSTE